MDMFHLMKDDDNNNLVEQNSKMEIQNKINGRLNVVGYRPKVHNGKIGLIIFV
jgi:hypothetical protein